MYRSKTALLCFIVLIDFSTSSSLLDQIIDRDIINQLENSECKRDLLKYIESKETEQEWARRMSDSSSNLPRGLDFGTAVDLGNYDLCSTVKHDDFHGKFCRVEKPFLRMYNFSHAKTEMLTNLSLGPIIRLGVLNLADEEQTMQMFFCVPSVCNRDDLNEIFRSANSSFYSTRCEDEQQHVTTAMDVLFILFLAGLLITIAIATAYDLWRGSGKAFFGRELSLRTNINKILHFSKNNNSYLHSLDALRTLSAYWVLTYHLFTLHQWIPTINPLDFYSAISNPLITPFQEGILPVANFLFLGGILVAYKFLEDRKKNRSFNLFNYYLHRYFRLTISLLVFLLFCIFLLPHLGSGPLWNQTMAYITRPCHKYWWSVLLHMQNIFNPREVCFNHAWYLTIDWELYLISPIILFPLVKWPRITIGCIVAVILLIPIYTGYVAWKNRLIIFFPIFDGRFAVIAFSIVWRSIPWFFGILVGYIVFNLRDDGSNKIKTLFEKIIQNKYIVIALWLSSILVLLLVEIGASNVWNHEYDPIESAIYYSLRELSWCSALSWMILYFIYNKTEFVSTQVFQILGRLSYSLYLIHLPLQFATLGTTRSPRYYEFYSNMNDLVGNMMLSTMAAVVWVLFIEYPLVIVEKMFFKFISMIPFSKCRNAIHLAYK